VHLSELWPDQRPDPDSSAAVLRVLNNLASARGPMPPWSLTSRYGSQSIISVKGGHRYPPTVNSGRVQERIMFHRGGPVESSLLSKKHPALNSAMGRTVIQPPFPEQAHRRLQPPLPAVGHTTRWLCLARF